MQVKVFEAKDMASGLKKIKETFGPDALILSTRTIRHGKLGIMGKSTLEITAAIDNGWEEEKDTDRIAEAAQPPIKTVIDDDLTYEKLWSRNSPQPAEQPVTAEKKKENGESQRLQNEIEQLKSTIDSLTSKVSTIQLQTGKNQAIRRPYVEPEFSCSPPDDHGRLLKSIMSYGINHNAATVLAEQLKGSDPSLHEAAGVDERAQLKAAISRMVTTERVLHKKLSRQKRISLIGPTGVGKTTTIAKLAAGYLNRFGGRVALITIDTYRIAAVEQLKVYGEIMRLPVEVVIKPEELTQAFDKYRDYDLILIDTAGRSPRNKEDLQEMASFIRPSHGIENHLMLSASTRERELEEAIANFSILPLSSLIFSKIDECERLGIIVNIQSNHGIPISFLTNGQRVPEDIVAPNPAVIADYIVNDHRTAING